MTDCRIVKRIDERDERFTCGFLRLLGARANDVEDRGEITDLVLSFEEHPPHVRDAKLGLRDPARRPDERLGSRSLGSVRFASVSKRHWASSLVRSPGRMASSQS